MAAEPGEQARRLAERYEENQHWAGCAAKGCDDLHGRCRSLADDIQAALDDARMTGAVAGNEAGYKQGRAEGAKAERERCANLAHEKARLAEQAALRHAPQGIERLGRETAAWTLREIAREIEAGE